MDYDDRDLSGSPPPDAVYVIPEAPIHTKTWWKRVGVELRGWLHRQEQLEVYRNKALRLYSRPGESEEAFRLRCARASDARADEEIASLRERFQRRFSALQRRVAAAERQLTQAQATKEARTRDEWISGAGSLLGAFLGGRGTTRRMARSVRGFSSRRTRSDSAEARVVTARTKIADLQSEFEELDLELSHRVAAVDDAWGAKAHEVEPNDIRVSRQNVDVEEIVLLWVPVASVTPSA